MSGSFLTEIINLNTRLALNSTAKSPLRTYQHYAKLKDPWNICGERKLCEASGNRFRRTLSTATSVPKRYEAEKSNTHSSVKAMSHLPWSTLLRSYIITWVTSNQLLLKPSLSVLGFLANTKTPFFQPATNPVLHALLKKTFYAHFCAGETPDEVRNTIQKLKNIGYQGVMMGHAREEVLSKAEKAMVDALPETPEQEQLNYDDIQRWKSNTLATLDLTEAGDFVALKFTGAGKQALKQLKHAEPCVPALGEAIDMVCQRAQARGVGLLFDAEQAYLQDGIENWTMHYMKRYNSKNAVVYATYQAYAKRTPLLLAKHLAEASKFDFVLGVKLVRGAYLNSDPRDLFWDTIEETHDCYDNIARCMIEQRYDGILKAENAAPTKFPRVGLVLASHNAESVRKAQQLRDQQASHDLTRIPLAYGQLMGMADHVSCDLIHAARTRAASDDPVCCDIPQAYKYLVWGTMEECLKYLFRRAQENKDAVSRTIDARKALGKEILCRLRKFPFVGPV